MVYFKVIQDERVIAVATSDNLRKHQMKHNVLVRGTEGEAQYLQIDDALYRDKWMKGVSTDFFNYEEVQIKAIPEDEYIVLADAIEESGEIEAQAPEEETAAEDEDELVDTAVGEDTVEFVREIKLKELSLACNKAIVNGFDVVLADEEMHHFSMTMQDQSNLLSIQVQLLAGAKEVPYHADGEESALYSADEMAEIINAANGHKTYHLVYFNALKNWVMGLKRVANIRAVEYGCEIPKKYRSALLKRLLEEQ